MRRPIRSSNARESTENTSKPPTFTISRRAERNRAGVADERPTSVAVIAAFLILGPAKFALAGMPTILLNDLARMRLQAVSFFLGCFLLSSWGIQRIWNAARDDFPRLPRLSYARANGLVAPLGAVVRPCLDHDLGSPGVDDARRWKKEGITYKLAEDVPKADPETERREMRRRHTLDRLRAALWTYARHHDGHFPPNAMPPEIPDDAWRVPDPSEMRYLYRAGLIADRDAVPLAYEPGIFGHERFVLLTSGEIVRMDDQNLSTALGEGASR